ncbi:hypothetical protein ALC62_00321 [Cyphomyrmex costatus]|uniref:Secreted protein n=1 Tax=Cyphomyrmex costatus TaxID=456900 RepID=A0A195D6Y4_9HYME|nr:hypothetical protein ALC62_00321 [Cyphomyrmex costatus]
MTRMKQASVLLATALAHKVFPVPGGPNNKTPFGESAFMILVQRATCRGCSFCKVCLSAAKSQSAGGARPVSDSLIPVNSFTRLIIVWISSSTPLILFVYCPWP